MLPNFGQLANGDRRGARGRRAQRAVEGRGVGRGAAARGEARERRLAAALRGVGQT